MTLRQDREIYNEATGFVITSRKTARKLGGKSGPSEDSWQRAIESGDLLPVELFQDDSFVLRVLVGELAPDEQQQWVGRVEGFLRIPDGKLVASGGIEIIEDPTDDENGAPDAVLFEIPKGGYRFELLEYANSINGREHLRRAGGYQLPSGLQPAPEPLVDFLLRLTPVAKVGKNAVFRGKDWIEIEQFEARRPLAPPVGLAAALPPPPAPPPAALRDVAQLFGGRALSPVRDGPVELPIERLAEVFRLAYLATDSAAPEVEIELPAAASFSPGDLPSWVVKVEGTRQRFLTKKSSFELGAACELAPRLRELPDEATVKLIAAAAPMDRQKSDVGVQAYRGPVSRGTWQIRESYPALDAATLRSALELTHAVAKDKPLPLRDEDHGAAAHEWLYGMAAILERDPNRRRFPRAGLTIDCTAKHERPRFLQRELGVAVFRTGWATVWPCWIPDWEAEKPRVASLELNKKEFLAGREPLYQGDVTSFVRADLRAEYPDRAQAAEPVDRALKEIGYRPVGDLRSSRAKDTIFRYFVSERVPARAYLRASKSLYLGFVTDFDAATLETTTIRGEGDDRERGIYRVRLSDLKPQDAAALEAAHRRRLGELSSELGAPRAAPADLAGCAHRSDENAARESGS
jgi:hypothetical protein